MHERADEMREVATREDARDRGEDKKFELTDRLQVVWTAQSKDSSSSSSNSGSEYSELMGRAIGVRIEDVKLIWDGEGEGTETRRNATSRRAARCTLTLHRDTCANPRLMSSDKILWSTRICYKWQCDTTEYAMRVESCWIGSKRNPVYIIREDGCTVEGAILSSPSYNSLTRAVAIGYMSVREKGMEAVTLHCNVRLCHLCDEECQYITPPRGCSDYEKNRDEDYERMWNTSSRVRTLCRQPTVTAASSTASFPHFSFLNSYLFVHFASILLSQLTI